MLTWGKSLNLEPQGSGPVVRPRGHYLAIPGGDALVLHFSCGNSETIDGLDIAVGVYVGNLRNCHKLIHVPIFLTLIFPYFLPGPERKANHKNL